MESGKNGALGPRQNVNVVVVGQINPTAVHTVGCCGVVMGFAVEVVATHVYTLADVHVQACGL
jgi:hypothetical protein